MQPAAATLRKWSHGSHNSLPPREAGCERASTKRRSGAKYEAKRGIYHAAAAAAALLGFHGKTMCSLVKQQQEKTEQEKERGLASERERELASLVESAENRPNDSIFR